MQVGRCDEMLRPILGPLGNPENPARGMRGSAPDELTLPSRSMRVFESVINADRLIHALLLGTDVTPELRESSSALLAGFPRIQEDIQWMESHLAGVFPTSEPKVSSKQSTQ
jgi:hypothetical protein